MDEILEIVKIGDDVLREKCTPVKEFDSAFKMLTSAMLDELLEADGVGLAAPQVGIPQRFFVVDIRDLWMRPAPRPSKRRSLLPGRPARSAWFTATALSFRNSANSTM